MDLQSLLIAVFHRRAAQQTPRRVLEQYARNPFVRPAPANVRALLELEPRSRWTWRNRRSRRWISRRWPLLGTCSALAPLDQNRLSPLSATPRSWPITTNVLALE